VVFILICVHLCSSVVPSLTRPAHALTFTVNTTADDPDATPNDDRCETAGGDCSLRAAIQQANATAGADEIELPAGIYSLVTPGTGENAAATGDLDVTEDLIIRGAGASTTIINGGLLDRIFEIDPARVGGVEMEISGVTIQDGSLRDPGGAILNNGTLSLAGVAVSDSTAVDGDGGGIFSRGPLTLTNVLINGNRATSDGGGIFSGGMLTITNSTISGNTAGASGGGIENRGILSLSNSTIASNSAGARAGGIVNTPAQANRATLRGTIIADNTPTNCASPMTSAGHNLGDAACGFTTPTDVDDVDALLCPLDNYGGPTLTHALQMGSGALDAAADDCPDTDQRGLPRPRDGNGDGEAACDIGAFEAEDVAMDCAPLTPTPTATRRPPSPTPTTSPTAQPTTPTPGPPAGACPGDCGLDDRVTIDEVLRAISIALGSESLTTCEAADRDGNGRVTVDELVAAVQASIGSCPAS
jgi:CSLREA domain-containing protein